MNAVFAVVAAGFTLAASAASAVPVTFDFTWTGSGGYSMVGQFTGEDLDADNVLRDMEVTALTFEGFQNGVSIGSTGGAQALSSTPANAFNFNFDLLAGTFLNGNSNTGDGQLWNRDGPGLGFFDGNSFAALTLDGGVGLSRSDDPQVYTATQVVSTVPLPAGLPLFGLALASLLGLRRRRR